MARVQCLPIPRNRSKPAPFWKADRSRLYHSCGRTLGVCVTDARAPIFVITMIGADTPVLVRYQEGQRHDAHTFRRPEDGRSEEHTSELQSLMRISYAVLCLTKKKKKRQIT